MIGLLTKVSGLLIKVSGLLTKVIVLFTKVVSSLLTKVSGLLIKVKVCLQRLVIASLLMTIGLKLIVFKWPILYTLRTSGQGSLIPNTLTPTSPVAVEVGMRTLMFAI